MTVKEVEAPKVIPNIGKDVPADQLPPPTEEALKISAQVGELRQNLIGVMKSFNKLLSSTILPENASIKDKENEQQIVGDLTRAAQAIDKISYGEGSLALSVFAVRLALFFRNAGNKLAYEIEELKKRIPEKVDSEQDINKKKIAALAKELGVDVKIK